MRWQSQGKVMCQWECPKGTGSKRGSSGVDFALKSVFVTVTIDAKEKQEIVTFNIPGAFLHTDNNDYVVMKMNSSLATLMVKNEP